MTKQQQIQDLGEDVLKQAFRKNQTKQKDEKLKLSKEEADKFEKAFEQKEFRDLMAQYVSEISDPSHRAEQEQYLRQLEEQNELPDGKDILRPQPGFVLKFKYSKKRSSSSSQKSKRKDKNEKLFINVVHSKQVNQPTYTVAPSTDVRGKSGGGKNWSLPYTFGPMRMEQDNKKTLTPTFDCCFHPLALVYASKSVPYRDLIAATVREGATKQFKAMNNSDDEVVVDIDQQYTLLKGTQYKNGEPPAMMVGSSSKEKHAASSSTACDNKLEREDKNQQADGTDGRQKVTEKKDNVKRGTSMKKGFLLQGKCSQTKRKMKNNGGTRGSVITPVPSNKKDGFNRGGGTTKDGDTIPSYEIIERGEFDITDQNIQGLNRPSARPKFLLIRVKLPGIKSVKRIELDVSEERLALKSLHSNPVYNLCIKLPYPVMSDDGSAKFDKETCTLTIHIPVRRPDVVTPWSKNNEEEGNYEDEENDTQKNIGNSVIDITNSNDPHEEGNSISSSPVLVEKHELGNDLNESPVIVEKPHNHSKWIDVTNETKSRNLREEFARDGIIPTLSLPSQVISKKKDNGAEFVTDEDAESSSVSDDEQCDRESNYSFQVVEHSYDQNDNSNERNGGKELNDESSQQQPIKRSNIIFELD